MTIAFAGRQLSCLGQYARTGFRTRVFQFEPLRGTIRVLSLGSGSRSCASGLMWARSPQGGDRASEATVTVFPLLRLDPGTAVF